MTTAPTPASPNGKTKFYSRLNGTRFVMPSGKILLFVGGMYETDDPAEIKELRTCISINNELLSLTPVPVKENTAKLLRQVGGGRGGNTGAQNSLSGSDFAALSNGS